MCFIIFLALNICTFVQEISISCKTLLRINIQELLEDCCSYSATNPSQFEIQFFVNDLSKPGASTFEFLGGLEYKQNIHIQLECERKQIPTDGLVLRGWYTTITLAVYGTLTKSLNNPPQEDNSASGSATCVVSVEESHPASTAQISSEQQSDWYYENQHQTNSTVRECSML